MSHFYFRIRQPIIELYLHKDVTSNKNLIFKVNIKSVSYILSDPGGESTLSSYKLITRRMFYQTSGENNE